MDITSKQVLWERALRTAALHLNITELHAVNDLIFAGEGNFVHIYSMDVMCKLHTVRVFDTSVVHGIQHGNYSNEDTVIVHGGKSFRCFGLRETSLIPLTGELRLLDWIWDCLIINEDLCAFLLAHNEVVFYNLKSRCIDLKAACDVNCILYSGRLYQFPEIAGELTVLAGTVFGDVIVWTSTFPTGALNICREAIHKLTGHDGVIFSVQYDSQRTQIYSTSDDRSLRIWKATFRNPLIPDWLTASIQEVYALYGHLSRVWRSLFLDNCLISVGEDAQLCVWAYDGVLIQKVKAHSGTDIWSIATDENKHCLFTGGGDSAIKMWPLKNLTNQFCLDERSNVPLPAEITYRNEKGHDKTADHVKSVYLLRSNGILVMTNNGSLYMCENGEWRLVFSDPEYRSYCVVSCNPDGSTVVLGSISGRLALISNVGLEKSVTEYRVDAYKGKILSVKWIDSTRLLTCGPSGSLKIWSHDGVIGSLDLHSKYLLPYTRQQWVSTCLLLPNSVFFICGDRGGTVLLYEMSISKNVDDVHECLDSLPQIHSKSGVSDVRYKDGVMYTSGRNGRVFVITIVAKRLNLLRSIQVGDIGWLAKIFFWGTDLVVTCFHQQKFVFWSTQQQSVLFETPCGGGHRSWDLIFDETKVEFVVIRGFDVHYTQFPIDQCFPSLIKSSFHGREVCDVISVLQSEKLAVLATGSEDNTIKIWQLDSGSCELKLVCTLERHISSVRTLATCSIGDQTGNVVLLFAAGGRAFLSVSLVTVTPDGTTVKELTTHMLIDPKARSKKPWLVANMTATPNPETRYMDLAAWQVSISRKLYVVAAASSDAFLRLFGFDFAKNSLVLLTEIGVSERCLLRISRLEFSEVTSHLLLITTTNGMLYLVDVSDAVKSFIDSSCHLSEIHVTKQNWILGSWKVQQSGVTALATKSLLGYHLVAFGGDDTSIGLLLLRPEKYRIAELDDFKVSHQLVSSAHNAIVSGLCFVPGTNVLVSASGDQRVKIWNYCVDSNDDISLCATREVMVSQVADISALEIIQVSDGANSTTECNIVLVGKGIEILKSSFLNY